MSIYIFLYCFYLDILYVKILNVKTVVELNDSMHLSLFNLEDIIEPIYSFILFCI